MRNLVRSIVLSEPVLAEPLEDANAAYDKQDYTAALRLFRPLADQGYASAQIMLGIMYSKGQGVPQDYVEAHKWFTLSAARASADEKDVRDLAVQERDILANARRQLS